MVGWRGPSACPRGLDAGTQQGSPHAQPGGMFPSARPLLCLLIHHCLSHSLPPFSETSISQRLQPWPAQPACPHAPGPPSLPWGVADCRQARTGVPDVPLSSQGTALPSLSFPLHEMGMMRTPARLPELWPDLSGLTCPSPLWRGLCLGCAPYLGHASCSWPCSWVVCRRDSMRDLPGLALPPVCFPQEMSFIMKVQGPGQSLPRSVPAQAWGLPQPTAPTPCEHRHPHRHVQTRGATRILRAHPASPHCRLGFRELFLFMTPTRPPPRKEQSGGPSVSLTRARLSQSPGSCGPSEPLMGVRTVLATQGCRGHTRGWVRAEGRGPGPPAGGS